MCFINTSQNLKKADKDIRCYKIMEFDGEKYLKSLIWRKNERYQIGDKIKASKRLSCFRAKNVKLIDRLIELNGEVVHSFTDLQHAVYESFGMDCTIVECIIPKGEYYWVNHVDKEYASVSLKISKILYFEGARVKGLLMWK